MDELIFSGGAFRLRGVYPPLYLRRCADSGTLRTGWHAPARYHVPGKILLEICVESLDCGVLAERARADRIELCSDLPSGGITPSCGTMRLARKLLKLPIHLLIRPRAGDFVYSTREFEIMRRDIEVAKTEGIDGIVAGVLDAKSRVDVKRTRELVQLAKPLPVTFHRAFDETPNQADALEAVIETGAQRILTSGGKESVLEALLQLSKLVDLAGDRIIILPGGGIRVNNITRLVRAVAVREVHTSLGASRRTIVQNGSSRRQFVSKFQRSAASMATLLRQAAKENSDAP